MGHAFLQPIIELVATNFELLPQRVDFLSFVLEIAAASVILGTVALLRGMGGGQPGAVTRPERMALLGALIATALFWGIYLIQKIG